MEDGRLVRLKSRRKLLGLGTFKALTRRPLNRTINAIRSVFLLVVDPDFVFAGLEILPEPNASQTAPLQKLLDRRRATDRGVDVLNGPNGVSIRLVRRAVHLGPQIKPLLIQRLQCSMRKRIVIHDGPCRHPVKNGAPQQHPLRGSGLLELCRGQVGILLVTDGVEQIKRIEGQAVPLHLHDLLLHERHRHRLLVSRGFPSLVIQVEQKPFDLLHLFVSQSLVFFDVGLDPWMQVQCHRLMVNDQRLTEVHVTKLPAD